MEEGQDQWRPRNSDENEGERGSPVTCADGEQGRTVELSLRTKWRRKNGVLDSYRTGPGRARGGGRPGICSDEAMRRAQSRGTGRLTHGARREKFLIKLEADPTLIRSKSYVTKLKKFK
jgi:hypothetical protein